MARISKNFKKMLKDSSKSSSKRGRYFAIEIYPESMPADWEDIIEKTSIPCALSPLHNRDGWWLDSDFVKNSGASGKEDFEKYIFNEKNICVIDEADYLHDFYTDANNNKYNIFWSPKGLKIQKKPHYHLLLSFGSPVTTNKSIDLSVSLGGNAYAELLNYPKAYYQYLTHENEPKKAQYLKSDIRCFNDFAWYKDLPLPNYAILREWREAIESIIDENSIVNLMDLKKFLRQIEREGYRPELFYYVDTHPAEFDRICRANYTAVDIQHRFTKKIDDLEDKLKEKDIQNDKLKDENKELKNRLGEEIFARNNPHLSKPKIENEPPIDF